MKYADNTPYHRKHTNSQCDCHQCKQFDYANTAIFPLSEYSPLAVAELVGAIDSETWERYNYYVLPPRRPAPTR